MDCDTQDVDPAGSWCEETASLTVMPTYIEGVTPAVLDIANSITEYHSQHVGYAGSSSSEYTQASSMWAAATDEELRSLCLSHPSPATRLYAYDGTVVFTKP